MPLFNSTAPPLNDHVRAVKQAERRVYLPQNVVDVRLGRAVLPMNYAWAEDRGRAHEPFTAQWIVDARAGIESWAESSADEVGASPAKLFFGSGFQVLTVPYYERIISSKPRHLCFDSYYATHHFFGPGDWVWLIRCADAAMT